MLKGKSVPGIIPVFGKIKNYHLRGAFYMLLYIVICITPLFIAMAYTDLPARGFWMELSVALGFVGLTMLSLQFLLTARYRRITGPYGIDVILEFHRYISLVAIGFIIVHPLILFIKNSENLRLLLFWEAPLRAQMAVLATVSLILLAVLSLYRKQLNIKYETWKISHGILAVIALIGALGHVLGVGYYLALPWKQFFWGGMFMATLSLLFYIRIGKPLQLIKRVYIVDEVIPEKGKCWTLVFRPDGHSGMKFRPGQFVWLTLGNSPFAIEDHPFSLSSSAERRDKVAVTIKELGDFTSTIKYVKPGMPAYLEGPHGAFVPNRHYEAKSFVFIVGGVGITPVMSMLRTFADIKFQRNILLIYANNTIEDITFYEELEELKKKLDLTVVHVLTTPPEGWEGETGFVTPDLLDRHFPEDKEQRMYFLCGPPVMMNAVERALLKVKVPYENIEQEEFNLV
ncbi:ferric reductase-like transmembrane domain-containing protein [Cytophagaceae bacterium ABcell3]|nr:ferric reductase-like transmembrane domain-containing protein [Cytophagaceae bacterium ABcell3]